MCCAQSLHLPKKMTEKPSVNHIGSSDEPPMRNWTRVLTIWNGNSVNSMNLGNLKITIANLYTSKFPVFVQLVALVTCEEVICSNKLFDQKCVTELCIKRKNLGKVIYLPF